MLLVASGRVRRAAFSVAWAFYWPPRLLIGGLGLALGLREKPAVCALPSSVLVATWYLDTAWGAGGSPPPSTHGAFSRNDPVSWLQMLRAAANIPGALQP